MADPLSRLVEADADATAAKARLRTTLDRLQHRLEPRRLAKVAAAEIAGTAHAAAMTARRNAGPLAVAIAAVALFFARRRIAGLIRRRPKATGAGPAR